MDQEFKDNMNLLIQRAKNADELINAILSFSRSVNKIDAISEVEVRDIIEELKTTLHKPEAVELVVPDNLPRIKTARTQFYQIFQNILSNAFKYAKTSVEISYEDLGSKCRFSIKDDGPGIDEQYHTKIFQIFQTAGNKKEKGSTGVGLSIVKKIIELFDGTITLESKLGEGAKFVFTLPKEARI